MALPRKKARKPRPAPSKKPQPTPAAVHTRVAEVLPLQLGQPGLLVAGKHNHLVTAGVPGDRLRIAPGRRTVELVPPPTRSPGVADAPPMGCLAEVVGVVERSSNRVIPPCPIVRECGGCSLQEMAYPAQLAAKREALVRSLRQLEVKPSLVRPIKGLSSQLGYRSKLLMVSGGRAGQLQFGFYRRGSTQLAAAEGCAVQHPLTLSALAMLRQLLDSVRMAPSSNTSREGWLHALGIRASPPHGLVEVTLVGRSPQIPGGKRLVDRIAQLPGVHGVHLCVSPERSSYPLGDDIRRLAGARRLPVTTAGTTLMLSPATFSQTCAEGADLLAACVLAALPAQARCLADLYGGAGLFARLAQGRYARALVAESSASAIADLRHALKQQQLPITAVAGRLEQTIDKVMTARPDVVIVDPPRKGCHSRVLDGLIAAEPRRVIYVACGIGALLADGQRLVAQGYRVESVDAVDMFPHTTHLEVVACFERNTGARSR